MRRSVAIEAGAQRTTGMRRYVLEMRSHAVVGLLVSPDPPVAFDAALQRAGVPPRGVVQKEDYPLPLDADLTNLVTAITLRKGSGSSFHTA